LLETRSSRNLLINYSERDFVDGEVFEIQLSANVLEGLQGTQFALNLDPDMLMIEEVIVNEETMCSRAHINDRALAEGQIKVSWNNTTELDVDSKPLMMTLKVLSKNAGSISEALSMDEKAMKSESYFNGNVGSVIMLPDTGLESDNQIVLYQNNPNPWSESTVISYYLDTDQEVTLNIYDVNGRLIMSKSQDALEGINEVLISKSDVQTSGVLFYELIADEHNISKKMLIVK